MARDSYTCIARPDRRAGLPIGLVLDDGAPVPGNQIGGLQGEPGCCRRIGYYADKIIRLAQIHQHPLKW